MRGAVFTATITAAPLNRQMFRDLGYITDLSQDSMAFGPDERSQYKSLLHGIGDEGQRCPYDHWLDIKHVVDEVTRIALSSADEARESCGTAAAPVLTNVADRLRQTRANLLRQIDHLLVCLTGLQATANEDLLDMEAFLEDDS